MEYAVLRNGEIAAVVTCGSEQSAREAARDMGGPSEVKALDSVPLAVKQRYRYWWERP